MESFFEVLKFILPAGLVFLTALYSIKYFLNNESRKRLEDLRMANQMIITPLRLQAYERVVLFLERVSPSGLILRVNKNGMSAQLLHAELVRTIRDEFEHNLSQQVYMSVPAWEKVMNAKEETIRIINIAFGKQKPNASSIDLAQEIFTICSSLDKLPTRLAIDVIKKEVAQVF